MKKCFIVHGSEDGVIGVATNKKAAYRIAINYAEYNNDAKTLPSYPQVCQAFKNTNIVDIGFGFGYAWIELGCLYSQ